MKELKIDKDYIPTLTPALKLKGRWEGDCMILDDLTDEEIAYLRSYLNSLRADDTQ